MQVRQTSVKQPSNGKEGRKRRIEKTKKTIKQLAFLEKGMREYREQISQKISAIGSKLEKHKKLLKRMEKSGNFVYIKEGEDGEEEVPILSDSSIDIGNLLP